MDTDVLVDHLFRHQSAKIVATLTRVFGSRNLDLAEDVVQDALLKRCSNGLSKVSLRIRQRG